MVKNPLANCKKDDSRHDLDHLDEHDDNVESLLQEEEPEEVPDRGLSTAERPVMPSADSFKRRQSDTTPIWGGPVDHSKSYGTSNDDNTSNDAGMTKEELARQVEELENEAKMLMGDIEKAEGEDGVDDLKKEFGGLMEMLEDAKKSGRTLLAGSDPKEKSVRRSCCWFILLLLVLIVLWWIYDTWFVAAGMIAPTAAPTLSYKPTEFPTAFHHPTHPPSYMPSTVAPSPKPTSHPTTTPSVKPTKAPSFKPTEFPTSFDHSTHSPSAMPSTEAPTIPRYKRTKPPTATPSAKPTHLIQPTSDPTVTDAPTSAEPTLSPTTSFKPSIPRYQRTWNPTPS